LIEVGLILIDGTSARQPSKNGISETEMFYKNN